MCTSCCFTPALLAPVPCSMLHAVVGRKRDDAASGPVRGAGGSSVPSSSAPSSSVHRAAAAVPSLSRPPAATAAAPAARFLGGVQCVTLSVPGTLLAETSTSELERGDANVLGTAHAAAGALAAAADLFLIAQVSDDVAEAAVRGALEHAGIVGTGGRGQVPPHR